MIEPGLPLRSRAGPAQLAGQLEQELARPPARIVRRQVIEVDPGGRDLQLGREPGGDVADQRGLADPSQPEVVQRPALTLLGLDQALELCDLFVPVEEVAELAQFVGAPGGQLERVLAHLDGGREITLERPGQQLAGLEPGLGFVGLASLGAQADLFDQPAARWSRRRREA